MVLVAFYKYFLTEWLEIWGHLRSRETINNSHGLSAAALHRKRHALSLITQTSTHLNLLTLCRWWRHAVCRGLKTMWLHLKNQVCSEQPHSVWRHQQQVCGSLICARKWPTKTDYRVCKKPWTMTLHVGGRVLGKDARKDKWVGRGRLTCRFLQLLFFVQLWSPSFCWPALSAVLV